MTAHYASLPQSAFFVCCHSFITMQSFCCGGKRNQGESPQPRWERGHSLPLCVPVPADSGGISFPCNHCFPVISAQQQKLTSWQEISMNGCACAALLGMDSNRLKCSKLMTCVLSACAMDYLHSWCSSCVHSTSGGPPQVTDAHRFTAQTQPASTAPRIAGGCRSSDTLPAMLCNSVSGKPHKDISRAPGGTCEGAYRLWKRCLKRP